MLGFAKSVLVILLLFSCGKGESGNKDNFSSSNVSNSIETATVFMQEVTDFVEATATVRPDKEGVVKVRSKFSGSVQSIKVQIGDYVKKGDLLAVVKTPDASDLYYQKAALSAQLSQAEKLYDLKKQLYDIGAIPKSELMEAQTNYEVLKAQLKSVEERLKLLGAGMGSVEVRAPKSGVVYAINVHTGDYIDSSTDMIEIVDPYKILIVGNIQEKDAFKIKKGDEVEFSVGIFPERTFRGKVVYVSDVVDPETRTIKVFIKPSSSSFFKVNMFFNIRIYVGKGEYAVVPKSALVYENGKFFVLAVSDGKIQKTEVSLVKFLENNQVAVLGVQNGQKVVTNPMVVEVSP